MKMMASGFDKLAAKVKGTSKDEHSEGHSEGHSEHHGGGQDEGKSTHSPVLIERAGACETSKLNGKGLRVAIVASHWYEKVVHSLVDACSRELLAKGVAEDDLHVVEVAGAFELPYTAARLIHYKDTNRRPDAVICIGCIVNDSTNMCETMSEAVAHGIMHLNVTSSTPIIYGVLSCDSGSQAHSCAEKRSCGGIDEDHKCNHGVAWAQSALQMAHLKRCASVKEMEQCSCVSCESRTSDKSREHEMKGEKHVSNKDEKCTSCKLSEEKCSCKECVCRVCCNHCGMCTSCKSPADKCVCTDCKCRSCCIRRDTCRGCGCPPDKCSCKGCNCAVCGSQKPDTASLPSSEHATKPDECSCQGCDCPVCGGQKPDTASSPSSEHATKQEGIKVTPSEFSKPEKSSSSGIHALGGTSKCDKCGNPEDSCKCGLLH